MDNEHIKALELASKAFGICYELNIMDGEYANGYSAEGPFTGASNCALNILRIAFGEIRAKKISELVFETDEYSYNDLVRFKKLADRVLSDHMESLLG